MKYKPEQLVARYEQLKSERGVWETHWQEIIDYFAPERMDVMIKIEPGSKRRKHMFDSSGPHAMELLVSALFSMLVPPQLKWIEFTTGDEDLDNDDEVRMFLQRIARKFLNLVNGSNFKLSVQEMFFDLAMIGTSPMCIEEDPKTNARFTTYPISEVVIDEDNMGRVNELYRCYKWNAKKLIMEFGEDAIPDEIKSDLRNGKNNDYEVIHGVYPKELGTEQSDNKLAYTSQYVLKDKKIEIRLKGFRQFPFLVPRWSKMSGEKYGRGPAMVALPETKQINTMEKVLIKGAQKTVDPPLQVPDDGVLIRPNTSPGGLNYVRTGSDPIRPILNDARIDFGFQVTDRTRNRIRECFYSDQLQLQVGPQMTATEVERRVERQMQLLGPILARLEDEFLFPLVDRVFEIMRLRGIVKDEEVPQALSGRDIIPRFSSTIARAQKASELSAIERTIQLAAPFIQADPTTLDVINGDESVKIIAKQQGLDQRMIRTDEEISAIREQRAQAQAEMRQAELENKRADSASKMGNTVAQLQASA